MLKMPKGDFEFAKRIRALRMENGLSQKDFAEKIGVRKTTVSNYETGYATPTYETLRLLMTAFSKPASYFLPSLKESVSDKSPQQNYGVMIPFFTCDETAKITNYMLEVPSSYISIPSEFFVEADNCIAVPAPDNNMNNCGIRKNNCVILNTDGSASDRDIIAAVYCDSLILRRFLKTPSGDFIRCESNKVLSANSIVPVPTDDFRIIGKVMYFLADAAHAVHL